MSARGQYKDERILRVFAGHGGPGCVHFHSEKYVERGGPDGGNGGQGGSVYIQASDQHLNFQHLYSNKEYRAADGQPGMGRQRSGSRGPDLTLYVPWGTQVTDADSGELLFDFTDPKKDRFCLLKGGKGGLGNMNFATSTNQAPTYAQPGLPGESRLIRLDLKLIADVGLVGLPNAGKSTLLSGLSAAHPKIAAYPFTTLEPVIGVVENEDYSRFTLADIPGLIEGASRGVGLGFAFLRHIERVSCLLFVIDVNSMDIAAEFELLLAELTAYNPALLEKKRLVGLSKTDQVADFEFLDQMLTELKEDSRLAKEEILIFSTLSGQGLPALRERLRDIVAAQISAPVGESPSPSAGETIDHMREGKESPSGPSPGGKFDF